MIELAPVGGHENPVLGLRRVTPRPGDRPGPVSVGGDERFPRGGLRAGEPHPADASRNRSTLGAMGLNAPGHRPLLSDPSSDVSGAVSRRYRGASTRRNGADVRPAAEGVLDALHIQGSRDGQSGHRSQAWGEGKGGGQIVSRAAARYLFSRVARWMEWAWEEHYWTHEATL